MTGGPDETGFGDLHDELRAVARDLLGKAGGETVPWQAISGAGWPGLEAPEEFGGTAATLAETVVVLEEVGRAAARTALPSVLALTVPALAAVLQQPLRDRVFRETVAGATVPVVVLDAERLIRSNTPGPSDRAFDPGFRLAHGSSGPVLDGSASFVADASEADLLLVPARQENGGIVLAVLEPAAAGLTVEPLRLVDATRSMGRVVATAAAVREVWQPRVDGARLLRTLHARAALAVTCDALGTASAVLDATVEYVRVREQFGRPIGSFQAVQHACANMLVQLTVARRLVELAVRAVEDAVPAGSTENAPFARESAPGPSAAELAVARAKAFTTSTAVDIAGAGIQLHGGYGYSWESGLHVHLKRATLDRALFGPPSAHRAFIAARYRDRP